MNRRSFLRGSGAALLGVATLGLAGKAIASSPKGPGKYVESIAVIYAPNTNWPYTSHIKLSGDKWPIIIAAASEEEANERCAYYVKMLGWKDGSRWYNRSYGLVGKDTSMYVQGGP